MSRSIKIDYIEDNAYNLLKPCVLSFVVKGSKKVWLTYGNCCIEVLGRNMALIKNKTHSCKELREEDIQVKVSLIENGQDNPEELRLEYDSVVENWKRNGYEVLSNDVRRIRYTVRIEPLFFNNRWFSAVVLKTSSNSKKCVGLFNTLDECEKFIAQEYPDKNNVYKIKFSSNYFTGLYRKNFKNDKT